MGFVTGEVDAPRLADPAYRRRLAQALAAGILNYLGAS
jgi:N-acetylmuramoyl-L-alanine amidase